MVTVIKMLRAVLGLSIAVLVLSVLFWSAGKLSLEIYLPETVIGNWVLLVWLIIAMISAIGMVLDDNMFVFEMVLLALALPQMMGYAPGLVFVDPGPYLTKDLLQSVRDILHVATNIIVVVDILLQIAKLLMFKAWAHGKMLGAKGLG